MYISSPAIFMDRVRPNSAACLMLFTVSAPAFARPSTLAPELCADTRKDEKSVVPGKG